MNPNLPGCGLPTPQRGRDAPAPMAPSADPSWLRRPATPAGPAATGLPPWLQYQMASDAPEETNPLILALKGR